MKGTMHIGLVAAAAALLGMEAPPPPVRFAPYQRPPTADEEAKRIARAAEKRNRKAAIRARARL